MGFLPWPRKYAETLDRQYADSPVDGAVWCTWCGALVVDTDAGGDTHLEWHRRLDAAREHVRAVQQHAQNLAGRAS